MIPSFETADELYLDVLSRLVNDGAPLNSRDGETREILGYSARLIDPTANFIYNPHRRMSPAYAAAEFLWYLSGEQSIDRIVPYAPGFARFANEREINVEIFSGRETAEPLSPRVKKLVAPGAAYGAHWFQPYGASTLIQAVIGLLRREPHTRQAVLGIWRPHDHIHDAIGKGVITIPCTLSLNFSVRDGRLYLTTTMRSNDVWLGLPNDMFSFTCLQILVAQMLGVGLGWYQHQAMSMHLYDRNLEKAKLAADPPSFAVPDKPYEWGPWPRCHEAYFLEVCRDVSVVEECNRKMGVCVRGVDDFGERSLLRELLVMAATKWSPDAMYKLDNKLMRKYLEK